MAHLRTQLRHALADLLINAVTADGDLVKISRNRVHAISEDMLPAAFITCNGDSAEIEDLSRPFIHNLSMDFEIQLAVADGTDVDDVIDDTCLQIQHLVANATLAGARFTKYTGTRLYLDEDNHGVMRADLSFTAFAFAAENATDIAL